MRPKHSVALSMLASASLIATAAIAAPATEGGKRFTTTLSGQAEVSTALPNGGAGDPNASGTATIVVNPGQGRLCWTIETRSFNAAHSITGAHIHSAFALQNGPIVIHLSATRNGTSTGCTTTAIPRERLMAVLQAPQVFYVNVHTSAFPAGAIRGQVANS